MAAWIPGSGEGRNPSPFRFAVRSGCLRQCLARTAYTNILDTTMLTAQHPHRWLPNNSIVTDCPIRMAQKASSMRGPSLC